MKKMAAFVKPFTIEQKIIIFEDGSIIKEQLVDLQTLSNTIAEVCSQYKINEVDIYGPFEFSQKIGEDAKVYAKTKYNLQEDLIIEYI